MKKRGHEKKGMNAYESAVTFSVAFVLMLLSVSIASAATVTVTVSADRQQYVPGDVAVINAATFIDGILVLSVPTTITGKTPRGDSFGVPVTNAGGTFVGIVNLTEIGQYEFTAASIVNGESHLATSHVVVDFPKADFNLVAHAVNYSYKTPVVKGSLAISGILAGSIKDVEIWLKPPQAEKYPVCSLNCSNCTFSCALDGVIQLGDNVLVASADYKGYTLSENVTLPIQLPVSADLKLAITNDVVYGLWDEAKISATLNHNGTIISTPTMSFTIVDPDGRSYPLISVIEPDGRTVTAGFNLGLIGKYKVIVEGRYMEKYTRAETGFEVRGEKNLVKLSLNSSDTAIGLNDNLTWILAPLTVSTSENDTRIDLSSIPFVLDYSQASIIAQGMIIPVRKTGPSELTLAFGLINSTLAHLEIPILNSSTENFTYSMLPGMPRIIESSLMDSSLCRLSYNTKLEESIVSVFDSNNNELAVYGSRPIADARERMVALYHPCDGAVIVTEEHEIKTVDLSDAGVGTVGAILDEIISLSDAPFNIILTHNLTNLTDFAYSIPLKIGEVNSLNRWLMPAGENFAAARIPEGDIADNSAILISESFPVTMLMDKKPEVLVSYINAQSPGNFVKQGDVLTITAGTESASTSSLALLGPGHNTLLYKTYSDQAINETFEIMNTTEPGRYLIIVTASGTASSDTLVRQIDIFSSSPAIYIGPAKTLRALRNSEIEFKHKITNLNFKAADLISLTSKSNYSTVMFMDATGQTALADNNRDGIPDTGLLMPGESKEITVRVIVPPSVPIGGIDFIVINASSMESKDAHAIVTDRVDIVAFLEEQKAKFENDLGITKVTRLDEAVEVRLRNYDDKSNEVGVLLTVINENLVEQTYFGTAIVPRNTTLPLKIGTGVLSGEKMLIKAVLATPGGESWIDDYSDNDYRALLIDDSWHIDSDFRVRIPLRELLNAYHNSYNIRANIALPDYASKDSLVVVIPEYDGAFSYMTGAYKILEGDLHDSAIALMQVPDVEANMEGDVIVYYSLQAGDNSFSDFVHEKTMNNDDASKQGRWIVDRQIKGYYGANYEHDLNLEKGLKSARYSPALETGSYELYIWNPSDASLSSNVPVLISSLDEMSIISISQQVGGGTWKYLGSYDLEPDSYVEIQTYGTKRPVIVDAMKFAKVDQYGKAGEEEKRPELVFVEPEIPVVENVSVNTSINESKPAPKGNLMNFNDRENKPVSGQFKKLSGNLQTGMDVEFTPDKFPVEKVLLRGVKNNKTLFLDNVKPFGKFASIIAVDPSEIDFVDGEISRIAGGTELHKCKDWNFNSQVCDGSWQKIMDLTPGQEYIISISPLDPAYAEIAQTLVCVKDSGGYSCTNFIDTGDVELSNVSDMVADGCGSSNGQDECGYADIGNVSDSYAEFQFGSLGITGNESVLSANVTFEYAAGNASFDELGAYCYNGTGWMQIGTPLTLTVDTNVTYALSAACYNSIAQVNDIRVRFGQFSPFNATGKLYFDWVYLNVLTNDTTTPEVQFVADTTASGSYAQNWIEANVTATDNLLANITIYLWNTTDLVQTNMNPTSPFYINMSGLPDGTYYLNATANDTDKNVNKTETNMIVLDTTKPLVQFVANTTASGNYSQTGIEANITASDNNLANITIYLWNTTGIVQTNTSPTSPQYISYTGLPDGTYYLNATANDTLGNINKTATNIIVLDTTNPPSVTYLFRVYRGLDWIWWNWSNPSSDFRNALIYLDGALVQNSTLEFYNATGLTPNSEHTLTVHTLDWAANINDTDVNSTSTTLLTSTNVIPPRKAQCQIQGGAWSAANCDYNPYDNTESCSEELVWCDDANVEIHTFKKNLPAGINMTYGEDTVQNCEYIISAYVYYQHWGSDASRDWQYWVTNGTNAYQSIGSGASVPTSDPNTNSTISVTSTQSWQCNDFFGPNATAKIRGYMGTGAGGPSTVYTAYWDLVVYVVTYKIKASLIVIDKSQYEQGESVAISGEGWDQNEIVTITVDLVNGSTDIFNTTSNAIGEISAEYNISYDGPLGQYNISAIQPTNTSLNGTESFAVTLRYPTVSLEYVYYDRTFPFDVTGYGFEPDENITLTLRYKGGTVFINYPKNVTVQPDGTFIDTFTPPSYLDVRTGNFTAEAYENDGSGHNGSADALLVVKVQTAVMTDQDESGVSVIEKLNLSDDEVAKIDGRNNQDDYITTQFPKIVPSTATIYNVTAYVEHSETNPRQIRLRWLNRTSGLYQTVCAFPTTTTDTIDYCDITRYANTTTNLNNLSIRLADVDTLGNGEDMYADLLYILMNFSFEPVIYLEAPSNGTYWNTGNLTFSYNVSHSFFSIDECKLYLDGGYEKSNLTVPYNTTQFISLYDISDGFHDWYVVCDDDSPYNNVGTSETRYFTIDTTGPNVTLNAPDDGANYTTPAPSINFNWTASDLVGPNITCNLTIDGIVNESNLNAINATPINWTVKNFLDGYHQWNVTCWDNASNTNTSETRTFMVDTAGSTFTNWNISLAGTDVVTYANITRPNILVAHAYWEDLSPIQTVLLEHNGNGSFENYTVTGFSGNETWANYSMNLSNTTEFASLGLVNLSAEHATDYFSYLNSTAPPLLFYLWGYSYLSDINADPEEVSSYGVNSTVSCQVIDNMTGTPIQNYNVSVYNNTVFYARNLTNATGWVSFNLTIYNETNITCEISDQANLFYRVTGGNLTMTVSEDRTNPIWSSWGLNVSDGANVSREEAVLAYAYWTDNFELGSAYIEHDGNGTFENHSITPFGGSGINESWSNYTMDLANGTEFTRAGLVNVTTIYGLDAAGNTNSTTPDHYFYLWSYINMTNSSISPSAIGITESATTYCEARDQYSESRIADVNVTFYSNMTGYLGSNVTNSTGWTSLTTQYNTGGLHLITCNISTQASLYSYAGYDPSEEQTIFVRKLANLTIWDQSDPPSNLPSRVFKQTFFYANYSDGSEQPISGAESNCSITFNISSGWTAPQLMTYNASILAYVYNRSFNKTGYVVWNVSCNSIYFVYKNVSDTVFVNTTVTSADSPTNDTIVDRDAVSSNIADMIVLESSIVNAPSGINLTFYANLTDPVFAGQTDLYLGYNTTNSSGSATIVWNPSNSYYAGNYTWWANASLNNLPIATRNTTRSFLIYGAFNVTFQDTLYDPNLDYNRTLTVRVNASLNSYGPESEADMNDSYLAVVNASLIQPTGPIDNITLTRTSNEWTGTYLIAGTDASGLWNVTLNSSAKYFFNDSIGNRNLTVYGFMNVSESSLSRNPIRAYEYTAQTCRVIDQHTFISVQSANVTFYREGVYLGYNVTNSSGHAVFRFQTSVPGNYNISCNVSDQLDIYYYSGTQYWKNDTLQVNMFPVTPVSPSNGTQVDRDSGSGAIDDTIKLNASVPSYVPDGVTISFYSNLTDPLTSGPVLLGQNTSSSGYAMIYYNPDNTSYVGNHTWFANASGAYGNGTMVYKEYGNLTLVFADNSDYPRSTYNQNGTLATRYNLTSPGPETRTELSTNYLAGLNTTARSTNGAATFANAYTNPDWQGTYSILTLAGVGPWNATGNTSATYFLRDTSKYRNFTVYGYMNVTDSNLSATTIGVYGYITQTCRVNDQHTGMPIQSVNISYYRNSTYLGYNTTNSSGHASFTFQTNLTGNYTFNCNVTDQLKIYYYAGDQANKSASLEVQPFIVTPTSPVNATIVDRDNVSNKNETVILVVKTLSNVPTGIPFTFKINLTNPGIAGQTNITIGTNLSNGTGYTTLYFNPNSTLYAGNYTWWAENPSSQPNGTRNIRIFGGINLTFVSSSDPNATYDQNDTALIAAMLESLGPESRDQLNSSYIGGVNASLNKTDNSIDTIALSYNGSSWNNSYQISYTAPVGVWNTTLNGSADYFFRDYQNRSFTVIGFSFLNIWNLNRTNGTFILACDDDAVFFANLTDTSNNTIPGASCAINFNDYSDNMTFNATSMYYEYTRTFPTNGNYSYNVTCNRTYYHNSTAFDNVYITPYEYITVNKTIMDIGDSSYVVYMSVVNQKTCPVNNVKLYDIIPYGFESFVYSEPIDLSARVLGQFNGNATYWLFNLSASQMRNYSYSLNASKDYAIDAAYIFGIDPDYEK